MTLARNVSSKLAIRAVAEALMTRPTTSQGKRRATRIAGGPRAHGPRWRARARCRRAGRRPRDALLPESAAYDRREDTDGPPVLSDHGKHGDPGRGGRQHGMLLIRFRCDDGPIRLEQRRHSRTCAGSQDASQLRDAGVAAVTIRDDDQVQQGIGLGPQPLADRRRCIVQRRNRHSIVGKMAGVFWLVRCRP